jgi:2'-5' RNA ligase
VQRDLGRRRPKRSWTLRFARESQLHVTVKFLGNVDAEQTGMLVDTVRAVARTGSACTSEIAGLGAFPAPRRARVVVVHLEEEAALMRLAREVETRVTALGFPAEARSFRPHVTLARLRKPGNVASWLEGAAVPAQPVRFERLVLFRSHPGPSGAEYTPLEAVPLG